MDSEDKQVFLEWTLSLLERTEESLANRFDVESDNRKRAKDISEAARLKQLIYSVKKAHIAVCRNPYESWEGFCSQMDDYLSCHLPQI